jgi:aconitate hydratase
MGAELGATTSIFPSDEQTRRYLAAQGREGSWVLLAPDPDATYDEVLEIDLDRLEPMVARPSSPDNVCPVSEVEGTKVSQVCVGSCTNSSFRDLMTVATMLKGKTVHPDISFTVTPGSKQVYTMIASNGALTDLIAAGGRILESACGPCIGMGQAPASGTASLRSFNRNFEGRSGAPNDKVYLASPEVCAASALAGEIVHPRRVSQPVSVLPPERFVLDDNLIVPPSPHPEQVEVMRGPNIKPVPIRSELPSTIEGEVLLKMGDNITTDHILPAGSKILPLRSNIPAISEYAFSRVDPEFARRAKEKSGGFVVGGSNYGQGSSREHAALAPMYLGLKGAIVTSFARIHRANLINFGILPLIFADGRDYGSIGQGDHLRIERVAEQIRGGQQVVVSNVSKGTEFVARHDLTAREVDIVLAGGMLNYTIKATA